MTQIAKPVLPASSARPRSLGVAPKNGERGQLIRPGEPAMPWNLSAGNHQSAHYLGTDCYEQMSQNLALLPAVLSSTKEITGPMSAANAALQFGENVVFTNLDVQAQGLVTKLVQGASVPTPYLIRGLCIVGRIVPMRYTTMGAALDSDLAEGVHVPEVVSPGSVPGDDTALQASFDYNSAGLIAYDLFLRTYQFQYVLQGRYVFVNERAVDIGVVDSMTQPIGFGSGKYDPSQDINTANVQFAATVGKIFAPPNCTVASAEGVAVNPPLVDIQWVQPTAPGVYGCCFPIRPHILWPMQSYQFFFQRTGNVAAEHDRLLQEITIPSFAKPKDSWSSSIPAGVNGPAVFLGVLPLRYFQLELGIMFRGGEFLPEDALEWLMRWGFPFSDMWLKSPVMLSGLNHLAQQFGLAGIPKPLPPGVQVEINGGQNPMMVAGMLGDAHPGDGPAGIQDRKARLLALESASKQHYGADKAYYNALGQLAHPPARAP